MWAVSSTNFSPPFRIVRSPVPVTIRFPSIGTTIPSHTSTSETVQSPAVGTPVREQFAACAGLARKPARLAIRVMPTSHATIRLGALFLTTFDNGMGSPPGGTLEGGARRRAGHFRATSPDCHIYTLFP